MSMRWGCRLDLLISIGEMKAVSSGNLRYIAGLIDGEGSIKANEYRHLSRSKRVCFVWGNRLRIRFADEQTIKWLRETTGIGCVYVEKNGRYQPMWNWQVSNKECADILLAVVPYLRTRKRQAQLMLQLRTCIETYKQPRDEKGRAMPIESTESRLRLHLCEQISRLNRGLPERGLDSELPPQLYLPRKRRRQIISEYVIGLNGLSATYAPLSPASSREPTAQ